MDSMLKKYTDDLQTFISSSFSGNNIEIRDNGNLINVSLGDDSACITLDYLQINTKNGNTYYKYIDITRLPLGSGGIEIWKKFCKDKILQKTGAETCGIAVFFDLIKDVEYKLDEYTASNTLLYTDNNSKYRNICCIVSSLNRHEVLREEPRLYLDDKSIWWGSLQGNVFKTKLAEINLEDIDSKRDEFVNTVANKLRNGIDDYPYISTEFKNYSFDTFINELKDALTNKLKKKDIKVELNSESRNCFMLVDKIKYQINITNTLHVYLPQNRSASQFKVYDITDELFDLPVRYSGLNSYLNFVVDAIYHNYMTLSNSDIKDVNHISLYENIKTVLGNTFNFGRLTFFIVSDEKSGYAKNKSGIVYAVFRTKYNSFAFLSCESADSFTFTSKEDLIDNDVFVDLKAMNEHDENYDEWCRRCDLIRDVVSGYKSFDEVDEYAAHRIGFEPDYLKDTKPKSETKSKSSSKTEDGFKGLRLVALKHDNEIIGYRFKGDNLKGYDISKEIAEQYGITGMKVSTAITLKDSNGLLMSKSEISSGKLIKDISKDSELIEKLLKQIGL